MWRIVTAENRRSARSAGSKLAHRAAGVLLIGGSILVAGCLGPPAQDLQPASTKKVRTRTESIPGDAVKRLPAEDTHPPVLHAKAWAEPVPLEGPVNTAGAEDSPFISPDGQMLFFFFTPDVRVPVEKQLLDGVTGIYLTRREGTGWGAPERVMLQDPDKLALDGCGFFSDGRLWFCTAREGYTGLHWFQAQYVDGGFINWRQADFEPSYEVGELHMHADELFFHSARPGGLGENDVWVSRLADGEWQPPENLEVVNSDVSEGYPFVTADGKELWFNRWYQGTPAIYRSIRIDGGWSEPELIVSQFAGEPTLDPSGNLYFVHHFFEDGTMIEADIYIAYKR